VGAFSFWSVLGLFLIGSRGVFFLVSSRSVSYWSQQQWGGIFFGVRSEVVLSLGSIPRVYFFA
jgi:hypothetical protein